MPRGRKPLPRTFEEQLALLDSQIAEHKETIEALKAQRKAVVADREKAELEQLLEAVKASGKSPAEFLAQIKEEASNESFTQE